MLVLPRHLRAMRRPPALLAAAGLLAYLVASFGLPLPAWPGSRAGCCAGACGCPAGERALADCCCAPAKRAPARPTGRAQAAGEASPAGQPEVRWVIGSQYNQCRGLATVWLSVGAALPPPPPVELDLEPAVCGALPAEPTVAHAFPCRPPFPPPRPDDTGPILPPVSTGERSAH